MKIATSYLLLFIFSFNFWGLQVIFEIQQYQLRKEIIHQIKNGITDTDLVRITIYPENKEELIWKDKEEEFSYKGTMYDIVYVETIAEDTKIYHCISDSNETKLIAKYHKANKKNRKHKNPRSHSANTVKFIQKINPLPQKSEITFSVLQHQPLFVYLDNYVSLCLDILSPPPKQVL